MDFFCWVKVLLLRRFSRRHPAPLATSFLIEFLSHSLRKVYAKKRNQGFTEVEKKEWESRDREFWWYALRGMVWDKFTR
jgi:hypothetical protein